MRQIDMNKIILAIAIYASIFINRIPLIRDIPWYPWGDFALNVVRIIVLLIMANPFFAIKREQNLVEGGYSAKKRMVSRSIAGILILLAIAIRPVITVSSGFEMQLPHFKWLLIYFTGACFEELFFKGFLYPLIKQKYNYAVCSVIVSVLFACGHGFSWYSFAPFIDSLFTFTVFYFWRSLPLQIGYHFLRNLTIYMVVIEVI